MNHTSIDELQAVGYLSDVPKEHREILAEFGTLIQMTAGERLISEYEPQESLYLVLAGELHVTLTKDGKTTHLATLGEGDSIGEVSFFDPGRASADVTSAADCLVWRLTHDDLDDLFDGQPVAGLSIMKGLLTQMAERIRSMNAKLLSKEKQALTDFWTTKAP